MNADIYNKILEDHQELASLPQTLSEVLRVISDDTSSAQDLSNVISRDPALTAKILRIVNSPYYGANREITTLSQAVMALGTRTVAALALSTSIYDVTGKWNNSIDRIRFWRHSLEVAIASREIAEAVRYPRIEEAFVAGLLHEIGLLVLEKSFPDKFKYIWNQCESGDALVDLEENTWGTNHARVGQFLLKQWHIPEVISDAVGQHHNNFPPETDDDSITLPQIVALSNSISKFKVVKKAYCDLESPDNNKVVMLGNLGIEIDRFHQIEENLMSKVVEEAAFLEIEVGSVNEILVEANRMLYRQYLNVENLLNENSQIKKDFSQAQMEKAALEALKTITATFNHYINNAAATILGRAQLIEVAMDTGEVSDPHNKAKTGVDIIIQGINTIQMVLAELKNLESYKTMVYHDDTYIINIEKKIEERLKSLSETKTGTPVT